MMFRDVRLKPRPFAMLTSAVLISASLCASGALAEELKGSQMGKLRETIEARTAAAGKLKAGSPYEAYMQKKAIRSFGRAAEDLSRAGFSDEEILAPGGTSVEDLASARLRSPGEMAAWSFDLLLTADQLDKGRAVTALTARALGGSPALTMAGLSADKAIKFANVNRDQERLAKFGTPYEKLMNASWRTLLRHSATCSKRAKHRARRRQCSPAICPITSAIRARGRARGALKSCC